MRKMKKTSVDWIGEIPESWGLKTIKQLMIERNEKNKGLEVNTILSLSAKDGVTIYDGENHSGNKPREDLSDYKIVRENDVVVNSMNILSGSVGLSKYTGVVSPVYYVYYPRFDGNIKFFHYIFQSFEFQRSLRGLGNGILIKETESGGLNTIRMRIPSKKLGMQEFPICSRDEQNRIVEFLDANAQKVDVLIANQEAQIEKLKAYKQSLITEVVTKGLDPNVPMKESGIEWIEKIPEIWSAVPLKTLFDFGKGLPITKENLVEEGIPVISYGQIHAKWNSGVTIHEELKRFVGKEYLETNPSCLVKKGDFIIADTSEDREGCGNAAYVDIDDTIFAGYHTVILVSKKPNVDNKYLAYLFLTDAWRSQLRKRVSGIKVFSISRKLLSETSVLVPDNASKMVELLDKKCSQIDRLISIKQQKIEKLNLYKKSLIYEYVTGKKEVPA
ncbi:MAG: restriction endonuclease subunit S [Lachnospiraceae bacterium]|nr:restriction endonuclease subunit S [Candidatus Darwinimomas equi]